jgi:hypothetical protein
VINPVLDPTKIKYACALCLTQCNGISAFGSHLHRCSEFLLRQYNKNYINKFTTDSLSPPLTSCKGTLVSAAIASAAGKLSEGDQLGNDMDSYNFLQTHLLTLLTPDQREILRFKNQMKEQQLDHEAKVEKIGADNQSLNQLKSECAIESKVPILSKLEVNKVLEDSDGSETDSEESNQNATPTNIKRKKKRIRLYSKLLQR